VTTQLAPKSKHQTEHADATDVLLKLQQLEPLLRAQSLDAERARRLPDVTTALVFRKNALS
jgi:hypothetical protein